MIVDMFLTKKWNLLSVYANFMLKLNFENL